MHEYERYSGYIPVVTTGSTTSTFMMDPVYSSTTTLAGPYSWREQRPAEPAVPARSRTNREQLAAEVDRVCALAQK
jgi:hypothetical protein